MAQEEINDAILQSNAKLTWHKSEIIFHRARRRLWLNGKSRLRDQKADWHESQLRFHARRLSEEYENYGRLLYVRVHGSEPRCWLYDSLRLANM